MIPSFLFPMLPRKQQTTAAKWLDDLSQRFLGLETHDMTLAQLEVVKRLADKALTKAHCELWAKESGLEVPPYNTTEWTALYDQWLESE